MNASLWQLAAWTMIHSLWIGAAVALAGGILRLAARRAAPNARYAVSLATLAALAVTPLAAAAWLSANGVPQLAAIPNVGSVLLPLPQGEGWGEGQPLVHAPHHPFLTLPLEGREPEEELEPSAALIIDLAASPLSPLAEIHTELAPPPLPLGEGWAATITEPNVPLTTPPATASPFPTPHSPFTPSAPPTYSPTHLLTTALPYLPTLWLIGAPLTFILLAAGLIGSERLRRRAAPILAGPAYEACQRLRQTLKITRRVALAACDEVAQPILVGIVRPLILLPTAALAGWTPEQLDMVLLHELAHVRRWDNLVNLSQRIVESLLFYHPAVWLVSRQVRRDREECCDATVVARIAEPHRYAELLVSIAATLRGGQAPSLAVASAMASHPLAGRIRRILNIEEEPMRITRHTLAATLLLPLLLAGAILYSGAQAEDGKNPPPSKGGARGGIEDAKQATTPDSPPQDGEATTDSPGSPNQGGEATRSPLDEMPTAEASSGSAAPVQEPALPAAAPPAATQTEPTLDPLSQALADLEASKQAVLKAQAALEKVQAKTTFTQDELIEKYVALKWRKAADHQLLTEQQAAISSQLKRRIKAGVAKNDAALTQLKNSLTEVEKEIAERVDAIKATVTELVKTGHSYTNNQIEETITNEEIRLAKEAISHAHNEFGAARMRLIQLPAAPSAAPIQATTPASPGSPNQGGEATRSHAEKTPPDNAQARPTMLFQGTKEFIIDFPPDFPDSQQERERIGKSFGYSHLRTVTEKTPQGDQSTHTLHVRVPADWNPKAVWESLANGDKIQMVCRIINEPAAAPPTHSLLPDIQNEIRNLETLIAKTKDDLVNLAVFKEMAVRNSQNPAAVDAAIAAKLANDPTIKMYDEQLAVLDSHLKEKQKEQQQGDGSALKRLERSKRELTSQRDKHVAEASQAIKARLVKQPNETLRAAIIEYNIRRKTTEENLAKHQQALAAAQAKLAQLTSAAPAPLLDRLEQLRLAFERQRPLFESRPDALLAKVVYDAVNLPVVVDQHWHYLAEGIRNREGLAPIGWSWSRDAGKQYVIEAPEEAHVQFLRPMFDGALPTVDAGAPDSANQDAQATESSAKVDGTLFTKQDPSLNAESRALNLAQDRANDRISFERSLRQINPRRSIETTQAELATDQSLLELERDLKNLERKTRSQFPEIASPGGRAAVEQTTASLKAIREQLKIERGAGGSASPNEGRVATTSPANDAQPPAKASPGSAAPVQEPALPANPQTPPAATSYDENSPDPLLQALADLEQRKQALLEAQAALRAARKGTPYAKDELIEKYVALNWEKTEERQILQQQATAISAQLKKRTAAGAASDDATVRQLQASLAEAEKQLDERLESMKADITKKVATGDQRLLNELQELVRSVELEQAQKKINRAQAAFQLAIARLNRLAAPDATAPPASPGSPNQGAATTRSPSDQTPPAAEASRGSAAPVQEPALPAPAPIEELPPANSLQVLIAVSQAPNDIRNLEALVAKAEEDVVGLGFGPATAENQSRRKSIEEDLAIHQRQLAEARDKLTQLYALPKQPITLGQQQYAIDKAFAVRPDNPVVAIARSIDPSLRSGIDAIFRAIAKRPDGSRIEAFRWEWDEKGGTTLQVTAPEEGQQLLFEKPLPDALVALLQNPTPAPIFPTLEHQQIVDRAYKFLGLELEPSAAKDAERAKSLGYTGGLLVTRANNRATNIQPGDLLVGLHVWPITDLKSLDEVLHRDDLNELNPLKYYVIRTGMGRGDDGRPEGGDGVVTGRLSMMQTPPAAEASRGSAAPVQEPVAPVKVTVVQPPASMTTGLFGNRTQTTAYLKVAINRSTDPLASAAQRATPQEIERWAMNSLALVKSPAVLKAALNVVTPRDSLDMSPDEAVEHLRKRLAATFPGDGEILELKLAGANAKEDAALLQAVIDAFIAGMNAPPKEPANAKASPGSPNQGGAATRSPSDKTPPTAEASSGSAAPVQEPVLPATPPSDPQPRKTPSPAPESRPIAVHDALLIRVAGAFPEQPIDNAYNVDDLGTIAFGPTYGRVPVVGLSILEAERAIQEQLRAVLQDPQVQVSRLAPPGVESVTPADPTFLYDGKTFEQWRDLWKLELNPERRTEAIHALAAFGRAGRGPEAADAILDVAGEYDPRQAANDKRQANLYEAIQNTLKAMPQTATLPPLIDRIERAEGNAKETYAGLVQRVLWEAQPDPQAIPIVLALAKRPEFGLQEAAAIALLRLDPSLENPDAVAVIRQALSDDKPSIQVLIGLQFRHLDKAPEQFDLLFHSDSNVQKSARSIMSGIRLSGRSPREIVEGAALASTITQRLLAILDDASRQKDHTAALLALIDSGDRFKQTLSQEQVEAVIERLRQILREGEGAQPMGALIALQKWERTGPADVLRNAGVSEERAKDLMERLQKGERME